MTDLTPAIEALDTTAAYFDVRGARNTGNHFRAAREALVTSDELTERDLRCIMSAMYRNGLDNQVESVLDSLFGVNA